LKRVLNIALGLTLICPSTYIIWFVLRYAYRMYSDPAGHSFVIRLFYGPIKVVEPMSTIFAALLSVTALICGVAIIARKKQTMKWFMAGLIAIATIVIGIWGALLN
jgi:hypothetical protein